MAVNLTPGGSAPYTPPTGPGLPPQPGGTGSGVGGTQGTGSVSTTPPASPLDFTSLQPPGLDEGSGSQTALDGPVLPPAGSMGNLSAADMIQLIRKEIKEVSELLQKAQAEVIKSQQTTMVAKSQATIAKLNDAIEKLEEARKIKDAMGIFNKIMYGVMGVVLAVLTPAMACMPPLAVLAWGAFAAYVTVNEKDNGKMMEDCMKAISEAFGTAWKDEGIDKQRENGMITFTTVMAALQIIVAIIVSIATFGAGLAPAAGTAAATTATSAAIAASQAATTAATATATTAATTAGTAATTAATAAATTAATAAATTASTAAGAAASSAASTASSAGTLTTQGVAQLLQQIAQQVQALVTIGTASAKIAGGVLDYQGTMLKADSEELKAQIRMLQNLLKNDIDLLQQLMQIQAEMDKGVASIVRDEHQTNEQLQQVTGFS